VSGKGGSGGTGGNGVVDGGGGTRDASGGTGGSTGGSGGKGGSGGTVSDSGTKDGTGGAADSGRDVIDGAAGAGGAGGGGNDGSAGKSGAGGATSDGGFDAGGKGGSGGGTTDGGSSACPTALVGWATLNGDSVSGTTGGGNAAVVRPTTAAELEDYASDATPRVIEISGTFAVPRLDVKSNKTIVGIGNNARINGGVRIRGSSSEPVTNVIVKNLKVNGGTTQVDNDAMQIYFAHHVWIDHCEIWDGPDGNLDMSHAVNWVTVSWTKFRYTTDYKRPSGETSDHRYSSLIGHSDDNATEDDGRLKISFHHNWWAELVIERMPRVRFGQVHVFNNYFSSAGNNYCVRAGANAHLLIEGNYFDGVNSPHQFNSTADEATASITERNNTYMSTTGDRATGGKGAPFTSVPYAATIEPSAGIAATVQACAGPR
jgi:pectate lyase